MIFKNSCVRKLWILNQRLKESPIIERHVPFTSLPLKALSHQEKLEINYFFLKSWFVSNVGSIRKWLADFLLQKQLKQY